MEILKKGMPPELRKYLFICHNCQCEFVAERSECTTETDIWHGTEYIKHKCPCCSGNVITRQEYYPNGIQLNEVK